jgi:outer membrane protein assembly factor BamB
MRHIPGIFLTILILIIGLPALADWPTLGGSSERHGQSGEIGPATPEILWEGATETAWFGDQCYIEDGRVVTMRFQGIHVSPIVCHDLETGAELWQVDFPGVNSRSVPRGFRDGLVYATNFQETGSDTLYALNAGDGSIVWRSEVFCERGIVWTISFTESGDLVVPTTGNDLALVDHIDGSMIWHAERTIPNTGAEGTCIRGDRVYGWEGAINTPKTVTVWDAKTGAHLYSSAGLAGDGDQEVPLVIGPDGMVYAKRDGGLLTALRDTGEGFIQEWVSPLGHVTYSGHLGVGLDGSVYIADDSSLARLDPLTGVEIDRSAPLVVTSTLNPRLVIDAGGTLYVGNSGSTDGRLYALAPDLTEIWSLPVPGLTRGGPAMGHFGTLVVAGNDFNLKAFRSGATGLVAGQTAAPAIQLGAWPNPFNPVTNIELVMPGNEELTVEMSVFDPRGRRVADLFSGTARGGEIISLAWRAEHEGGAPLPSGVYLLRARLGRETVTRKLVLVE